MITIFMVILIIGADTMILIMMIIFVRTMENNFSNIQRVVVVQDHKTQIRETTETYRWVYKILHTTIKLKTKAKTTKKNYIKLRVVQRHIGLTGSLQLKGQVQKQGYSPPSHALISRKHTYTYTYKHTKLFNTIDRDRDR